ncbi:MAG TPA: GDSL-type esterase/lipase family protein [Oculatellaceae cyanobacterium]
MKSLTLLGFSAVIFFCAQLPLVSPPPRPAPWLPGLRLDPPAKECRAYHWKLVKQVKQAQPEVLFLGDSITGNWMDYGLPAWNKYLLPLGSFDIGIAGEITQSILWRLQRGAIDGIKPKVVVLMIGINNLSSGDSAIDTVRGIKEIISVLRNRLPDSKILLLAILPRELKSTPPALQQKIIDANRLLAQVHDDRIYFLDLSKLALENDSTGFFIDGLHPALAGYQRLGPPLAKAIEKLKAPNAVIAHRMPLEI